VAGPLSPPPFTAVAENKKLLFDLSLLPAKSTFGLPNGPSDERFSIYQFDDRVPSIDSVFLPCVPRRASPVGLYSAPDPLYTVPPDPFFS